MNEDLKLLLLEDNVEDAELIQVLLRRAGIDFSAVIASNEEEFLTALDSNGYHAVLADNALPQYSSLEALKLLRITNPNVAFILVTGTVSEEFAVNIIQQGADDYVLKTNLARLPSAVTNAIEKKRNLKEKEIAVKETHKEKELSVSIINSLPGIFYICKEDGKFLRWNKNFEIVSGYNEEEIVLMTPEYFFSGPDKNYFRDYLEKCFKTGSAETEVIFVTRQNRHIPYFFTGMAIRYENKDCIICIGLDITASKQSEKKLMQLNENLHEVLSHMETIRENEQTRIAREVHDQIGQQLTGLKMDVSWFYNKMKKNNATPDILSRLGDMSQLLDDAVVTVRRVASDLRPPALDDFGIIEALEWQSKEFAKRSEVQTTFTSNVREIKVGQVVSIGMFRIYQEALTNVARHAEAKNVSTSFDLFDRHLSLKISDDGIGFDTNEVKKTLGMLGMKERAYMFGGTVTIESSIGNGTSVIVNVPL